MNAILMLGILTLTALAPVGVGEDPCVPTSADPATYNVVDLTAVGLGYYYVEERDSAVPNNPPIPESAFLTGNGTWVYEETNDVDGLQRGDVGLLGDWFPPGCEFDPIELNDVLWRDGDAGPLVTIDTDDPTQSNVDPEWVNSWHVDPFGINHVPCLIIDEDPIKDETCGYGPDTLVL